MNYSLINPFSHKFFLVPILLNVLVLLYNFIPNIGVIIILLTLLVRLILAPSFHKSLKGQKAMNDLQPKLNEMREKHKDNKEAQAKAMMELYKEHKINPLSSCLPLLIQLPILIALYFVFTQALGNQLNGLWSFVHNPGTINPFFLGINLAKASLPLGIIAGAAQFWQSKMMLPKTAGGDATAKAMQLQTTYVLPVISAVIAIRLPAGLPLYWIVTTLFAIGQQYYLMRKQEPGLQVTSNS